MDVVTQGRKVIQFLERHYREAEAAGGRPEPAQEGVPEPTDVDVRAAHRAAADLLASAVVSGSWEDWLRISWFPYLRRFPGPDRQVGEGWKITDNLARFPIDGANGRAFATTRFDRDGRLVGLVEGMREKEEGEPPSSVTIASPPERMLAMKAFYKGLIGKDLPCREGGDPYIAPRWPDPEYPQQMHLDIFVADLDASEKVVSAHGGRRLQDRGAFRIYADPLGHPLCLYGTTRGTPGTIARIVIDCPDPRALARFYDAFLRMPLRIEDSPSRVVIAREVDRFPMLAFQRADHYVPPRWPDPAHPAQMHFDLMFDDRAAAEHQAVELGATWLRPQHEEHFGHVYADPAGHPFCLLEPGD